MNDPKLMSIGQVSRIAGVHIKSLRYYDQIGVLRPAYTNPDTGYRYYTTAQLYTLEAIQLCIELDIPLKEFSRFIGEDQHLHYDALIAYGNQIMQARLAAIQRSMEIIRASQQEMETTERYKHIKGIFERDFQGMTVVLMPIQAMQEDTQSLLDMTDLYAQYQACGITLGYDYGYLFDYHDGSVDRYSYVQIIDAPAEVPYALRVLPGGPRACLWSQSSMIESAATLFADAFRGERTVTAVETELMRKDTDIHHPYIELSILP